MAYIPLLRFNLPGQIITDHRAAKLHVACLVLSPSQARERGYSICDQGLEEGVISVAAAILAADGFALGTIAVAAPKARTTTADITQRGLAVMAAAREISMRLNGDNLQTLRRLA